MRGIGGLKHFHLGNEPQMNGIDADERQGNLDESWVNFLKSPPFNLLSDFLYLRSSCSSAVKNSPSLDH